MQPYLIEHRKSKSGEFRTRRAFRPRFSVIRFFSALFVLGGVLFPPAAWGQEEKAIKVPFELLKSQHMAVQVKINGKGPYRLIFDTGAPVTLINNKVAKEAEVFPKNFKKPIFALFGSNGQFDLGSLEIGDARLEKVPAIIMDHPTVAAIASFLGPIEGIVGFSFFARYRMTIDYQAKELTLVPTTFDPPNLLENLTKSLLAASKAGKKTVVPAGQLGLRVKEAGDKEAGVVIDHVYTGSAAHEAGLKAGDRLLTLDGRWTDTMLETYDAASLLEPGSTVPVQIRRDGKEHTLKLQLRPGL